MRSNRRRSPSTGNKWTGRRRGAARCRGADTGSGGGSCARAAGRHRNTRPTPDSTHRRGDGTPCRHSSAAAGRHRGGAAGLYSSGATRRQRSTRAAEGTGRDYASWLGTRRKGRSGAGLHRAKPAWKLRTTGRRRSGEPCCAASRLR